MSAVADAAMPVPRHAIRRGIGPGAVVSAKAVVFGKEYAKDNFGKDWRTSRVYGTVRQAVGRHLWQVDFQGENVASAPR